MVIVSINMEGGDGWREVKYFRKYLCQMFKYGKLLRSFIVGC